MHYRNFAKLLKDNPDLGNLAEHIGPPLLRSFTETLCQERRKYFDEVVEFIDFRPFNKLNTNAPISSKKTESLNGHHNPSREEVRYVVRFRYEDSNEVRGIDPIDLENLASNIEDRERFPKTIGMLLGSSEIFGRSMRNGFKHVIFVAVLKVTRIWDGDWDRYSKESVEIYRFPEALASAAIWKI